jgi:hypothetical protein
MPTKTKPKSTSSKRAKNKKATLKSKKPIRKKAVKKVARTKRVAPKKVMRKKIVKAKTTAQKKPVAKKKRRRRSGTTMVELSLNPPVVQTGRLSGDLQGLSTVEGADSESVAELLEEGNPFEADIVRGVEDADADEKEVRTHEVREDDVPEEYFDNE